MIWFYLSVHFLHKPKNSRLYLLYFIPFLSLKLAKYLERPVLLIREEVAAKIKKNPREYIAQPLETLSTAPTITEKNIEPRHLDLRPFVLSGKTNYVTTGGLTRVALRKGSTIVNSSQGGGSKDTLIVD